MPQASRAYTRSASTPSRRRVTQERAARVSEEASATPATNTCLDQKHWRLLQLTRSVTTVAVRLPTGGNVVPTGPRRQGVTSMRQGPVHNSRSWKNAPFVFASRRRATADRGATARGASLVAASGLILLPERRSSVLPRPQYSIAQLSRRDDHDYDAPLFLIGDASTTLGKGHTGVRGRP